MKESQIANALANLVVAKVRIIENHVIAFMLLIIFVVEFAATKKGR